MNRHIDLVFRNDLPCLFYSQAQAFIGISFAAVFFFDSISYVAGAIGKRFAQVMPDPEKSYDRIAIPQEVFCSGNMSGRKVYSIGFIYISREDLLFKLFVCTTIILIGEAVFVLWKLSNKLVLLLHIFHVCFF